jgi:hypothetical protein
LILKTNGIEVEENVYQQSSLPLVNMTNVDAWMRGKELVKGVTARWLVPVVAAGGVDALVMVVNVSKEV